MEVAETTDRMWRYYFTAAAAKFPPAKFPPAMADEPQVRQRAQATLREIMAQPGHIA
jgi:hypothetical protein